MISVLSGRSSIASLTEATNSSIVAYTQSMVGGINSPQPPRISDAALPSVDVIRKLTALTLGSFRSRLQLAERRAVASP